MLWLGTVSDPPDDGPRRTERTSTPGKPRLVEPQTQTLSEVNRRTDRSIATASAATGKVLPDPKLLVRTVFSPVWVVSAAPPNS